MRGVNQTLHLNIPQSAALISADTMAAVGSGGGIYFYWLNLPSWQPPLDPSWNENPFNNSSWKLFYHSLGWLNTYAALYQHTNDTKYLMLIDNYLDDYDRTIDNPHESSISGAYQEDAVSLRVSHLLRLYLLLYASHANEEKEVIERLLDKDIEMLLVYLEQLKWDDKNHGLIQARAALNIAAAMPLHDKAEMLQEFANRRITAASELLFSESGYVVEQATEYHFVSLSMMLEINSQLRSFNMPENGALKRKIEKALIIAPYLLYPDGTMPAIGDSSYGKNWSGYLKRFYQEYQQLIPELEDYFALGEQSLEKLMILHDEGLMIAKTLLSGEELSKVFFDVGKSPIVHGHYDNLNVVAMLNGQKLLVDSGGPFTYEKDNRELFWQNSAHNLIIVNGEEKPDSDAEIVSTTSLEKQIEMVGKILLRGKLMHSRSVILSTEKTSAIVVVDSVSSVVKGDKTEQYWHYSPEIRVNPMEDGSVELSTEKGELFYQYQLHDMVTECHVLKGEVDSNGQPKYGWVTPSYNRVIEAPILKCEAKTNDYFVVNIFSSTPLTLPFFIRNNVSTEVHLGNGQIIYSSL